MWKLLCSKHDDDDKEENSRCLCGWVLMQEADSKVWITHSWVHIFWWISPWSATLGILYKTFFLLLKGRSFTRKLIIESWKKLKQHPPLIFTATNWIVVQNSQLNARQDQMSHFITSIHITEVEVPFIQVQEQWRRSVYMYIYTTNYVSTNAKSHYISWINQPFLTER